MLLAVGSSLHCSKSLLISKKLSSFSSVSSSLFRTRGGSINARLNLSLSATTEEVPVDITAERLVSLRREMKKVSGRWPEPVLLYY